MKTAVAYLEPHMEKADAGGKGTRRASARSRATCTTSARTSSTSSSPTTATRSTTSGSRRRSPTIVDKAIEVDADAIGMSGLLVKSTLIMRENLEELNTAGLAEIPVLLGGAALTRNYVERDLREVYDGRLFYGKDAFEGLHTMDTLMEGKRTGVLDPDFGRALGGRELPPRRSEMEAERGGHRGSRRAPTSPTDVAGLHAAVRRLTRREGHLARRDRRRTSTRPRCSATSGSSGPTSRAARPTPSSRRASARRSAAQLDVAKAGGLARARGRVGLLPGQRRRQRPRRVEGRRPAQRVAAVHVPAPAQRPSPLHRRLLPPASRAATPTTPRSTW